MRLATSSSRGGCADALQRAARRRLHGFTLAEVMAAMLFLAVVIPVAVEVLHVATLGGEVAARKGMAVRIADRVLNESLVTTNWNAGTQNGEVTQGGLKFDWTLSRQSWTEDTAMEQVTAEVKFTAQAKEYSVKLETLVLSPNVDTSTLTQ